MSINLNPSSEDIQLRNFRRCTSFSAYFLNYRLLPTSTILIHILIPRAQSRLSKVLLTAFLLSTQKTLSIPIHLLTHPIRPPHTSLYQHPTIPPSHK